ncbi:GRB2-related adapter protein [Armadillidium nasatum]|uniref:GRB2-related adapter protein n=1 Tax=Armadillidium nasatum TaxID=96803 RepID=A0A5N5SMU9_9CRUS|nr:GRB2-related adapter protein [Armadillidium nasatum]
MSREEAAAHLAPTEEGTFLLRWSDKHNQPIVSIKAMNEVKHMRVHRQQQKGYFYFSDTRYFPSIVELINFYRQFKLSECFQGLDRTLKKPLYDTATVLFPYQANGHNQLKLREGQRVIVVSREGESMGWWKGRIGDKTGYFPKEYVRVDTDSGITW